MARLALWFSSGESPSLEKTLFSHPLLEKEQRAVRGKTSGAHSGYNSFQWSPAVQSLAVLLLRTAALPAYDRSQAALLEGEKGSLASSLDFALGKAPNWVLDIFGLDRSGTPLVRRIFRRTNPERKRPGPVAVAVNENFINRDDISVFLDGQALRDAADLKQCARQIEKHFDKERESGPASRSRSAKVVELKAHGEEAPSVTPQFVPPALLCPCCGKVLSVQVLAQATGTHG